jgi:methionyl-tRNA formyltransferase
MLFLAKDKPFAREAASLIASHIINSDIIFGATQQLFPAYLLKKQFDYVISYVSPWIVPKQLLDNAKIASINFHPGPPEYPGIGCTNFALYNDEREFGITVHHMAEKVDTGRIIHVERFPIFKNDTVFSLTQRCYSFIHIAFVKIFYQILSGASLPTTHEKWKRKPYTRRELNELCVIKADMSEEEIKKRVRATAYPNMPGAYIECGGIRFNAENDNESKFIPSNEKDYPYRGGGTPES